MMWCHAPCVIMCNCAIWIVHSLLCCNALCLYRLLSYGNIILQYILVYIALRKHPSIHNNSYRVDVKSHILHVLLLLILCLILQCQLVKSERILIIINDCVPSKCLSFHRSSVFLSQSCATTMTQCTYTLYKLMSL